jgi:hypothetical protein
MARTWDDWAKIVYTEWRGMLAAGTMPYHQLVRLRHRLMFTGEFPDDDSRRLMLADLDDALTAMTEDCGRGRVEVPGDW